MGQIGMVNIYGPVMCSLCEKWVRKYGPKFSQNHMVRNWGSWGSTGQSGVSVLAVRLN